MSQLNVVLFGGTSNERSVSTPSAQNNAAQQDICFDSIGNGGLEFFPSSYFFDISQCMTAHFEPASISG